MKYNILIILILSLFMLSLIGLGCGKKGDPLPPLRSVVDAPLVKVLEPCIVYANRVNR
ncbi:MAG: hypothetical protein HQK63_04300 [Desulfamplus sp.]|nr:hypothetical protein [Desulfamplus sp.]